MVEAMGFSRIPAEKHLKLQVVPYFLGAAFHFSQKSTSGIQWDWEYSDFEGAQNAKNGACGGLYIYFF